MGRARGSFMSGLSSIDRDATSAFRRIASSPIPSVRKALIVKLNLRIFVLAAIAAVYGVAQTNVLPQIVELNAGESAVVEVAGGKKTLKLLTVKEHTEPYYQSKTKSVVDAVVAVEMSIDVDGVTKTVMGGPFRMPVDVNGLAVLLSNSKGLNNGIVVSLLSKDVRLEVAANPEVWATQSDLAYPIRNYRWHAMNYQHTYLGIAVNQALLYYHRGEDMGMIPDRDLAVAMTGGEITQVPGPSGDGKSNSVVLKNDTGFLFRYAHMNAPHIFTSVQPGGRVSAGTPLGLTGNTWTGRPVRDPHLHVELQDNASGVFRNSFPIFVAAYRASYPGELLPVAGGWRHLYANESVVLDGSRSLAGKGRSVRSFEWQFTDGAKAKGAHVTRRYANPGTYSEQLKVTDDTGKSDIDFVEVFVLSRDQTNPPPFAWINYFPIRNILPGTEIEFLTRFSNMKSVAIDFGDGRKEPWAEHMTHRYEKSGVYIVTVRGADAGSGPGTFHVRVIVD